MDVIISPKLQDFVWEIKRKERFSIKEIIILKSIISSEVKWMIYVDDIMDFLFVIGISLFVKNFANIFSVEIGAALHLFITGTIFISHKLFWYLNTTYSIYKGFKNDGIRCSEVEAVSKIVSIIFSKHCASNFLVITNFLYSHKTQKEVFEPLVAEWQYEYFEDLRNKRFRRAKMTNLRWTYHFLTAMWQKSPIGDLIEFISKFAK